MRTAYQRPHLGLLFHAITDNDFVGGRSQTRKKRAAILRSRISLDPALRTSPALRMANRA
jgi:hypothetical protein